jgi:hypothetical protein
MKKLVNDDVDLTLWQRDRRSDPSGMSSRYCGLRLVMVSFRRLMCQIQSLPRAFEMVCIPFGPEDLS